MKKLSLESQLALEKFSQVNQQLEQARKENDKTLKELDEVRVMMHKKQLRLEVAEGLLCEMLKQMQRKYNARKDAGCQANMNFRRNQQ